MGEYLRVFKNPLAKKSRLKHVQVREFHKNILPCSFGPKLAGWTKWIDLFTSIEYD